MNAPIAMPERFVPEPIQIASSQDWSAAIASSSFSSLMTTKLRCIVPLLAISFTFAVTMALLAGYAQWVMAQKVVGSFNVGYLLIVLTYVLCWVVSLVYVLKANRSFDAQSIVAIAALKTGRRA